MNASSTTLRDRLRLQAEQQRKDLGGVSAVSPDTYDTLVKKAGALEAKLRTVGCDDASIAPIADQRRLLDDVSRQLKGNDGTGVPPPNNVVYAAAVDIVEFGSIADVLGSAGPRWTWALRAHAARLAAGDTNIAADRLALSLASLLRRSGLEASIDSDDASRIETDLAGWDVAFAFQTAGDGAASAASATLRGRERAGMIVLEVGAAIPAEGLVRGASDSSVLAALGDRLERYLVDQQPVLAEQSDPAFAFAALAHATLAGMNVASRRLVFAEVWRVVNLCPMSDPRIDKLRVFAKALGKADVSVARK